MEYKYIKLSEKMEDNEKYEKGMERGARGKG